MTADDIALAVLSHRPMSPTEVRAAANVHAAEHLPRMDERERAVLVSQAVDLIAEAMGWHDATVWARG